MMLFLLSVLSLIGNGTKTIALRRNVVQWEWFVLVALNTKQTILADYIAEENISNEGGKDIQTMLDDSNLMEVSQDAPKAQ